MRSEKVSILNEVIDRVKGSSFCFVLNYGGISVKALTALRVSLRAQKSHLMIVKNTLLGKAAKDQGLADLSAMLSGPTAMVTGQGDVAEVAKILAKFVKDNELAAIKGATLDKALLAEKDIKMLATLPSKDAMRAKLLGTFQAPASSFVRVLNASVLQVLYVLQAEAAKKGKEGSGTAA